MARFGYFILGGIVGAIGALFMAPRSGEETRAIVADKATSIASDAQTQ